MYIYDNLLNEFEKNKIQNIYASFEKGLPPREGEEREWKDGWYKYEQGHWHKRVETKDESKELKDYKEKLVKCQALIAHYKDKKHRDEAFTVDEKRDFEAQKNFRLNLEGMIKRLEKKGVKEEGNNKNEAPKNENIKIGDKVKLKENLIYSPRLGGLILESDYDPNFEHWDEKEKASIYAKKGDLFSVIAVEKDYIIFANKNTETSLDPSWYDKI